MENGLSDNEFYLPAGSWFSDADRFRKILCQRGMKKNLVNQWPFYFVTWDKSKCLYTDRNMNCVSLTTVIL